jgi:hypothetical protein
MFAHFNAYAFDEIVIFRINNETTIDTTSTQTNTNLISTETTTTLPATTKTYPPTLNPNGFLVYKRDFDKDIFLSTTTDNILNSTYSTSQGEKHIQ